MAIGWIISLITIFVTVYGYDLLDPKHTGYIIYNAVNRNTWSLALAFIVYATAKVIQP